jgi:hypothetical protein
MCAGNATDCIYREYFDSVRGGVLGTPVDKMKLHKDGYPKKMAYFAYLPTSYLP